MGAEIATTRRKKIVNNPLSDYIIEVENFQSTKIIKEKPFGELRLMFDSNERDKYYFVKTIYIDLSKYNNSAMFFNEIRKLSSIFSPLILPFVGFTPSNVLSNKKPSLIYEYKKGNMLSDLIKDEELGNSFDVTSKIGVLYGVLIALNKIHDLGFTHGSLKASNILVTEEYRPFLCNFSFYHVLDEELLSSRGDKIWRAPEFDNPAQTSKEGDIYSFGFLLLNIFSKPDDYNRILSSKELFDKIRSGLRPKIPQYIPPEIKDLIEKCWDHDPLIRPTCSEIISMFSESVSLIQGIDLVKLQLFREMITEEVLELEKSLDIMISANEGDAANQNKMGIIMKSGDIFPKNKIASARYFSLAANQNHLEAITNYAFCLESGFGVPCDYCQAAKYYLLAANRGYKVAQYNMAVCFLKGQGVQQSIDMAKRYLKLCMEKDYAPGYYRYGILHETGEVGVVNVEEAARMYKIASSLKYIPATYRLGYLLINEIIPNSKESDGYNYIITAAQSKYPRAVCILGTMHIAGRGVEKSLESARKCFDSAISLNDPGSYFALSFLDAINNDKESADKNLRLAAKYGYIDGMKILIETGNLEENLKDKYKKLIKHKGVEREQYVKLELLVDGTDIKPNIRAITSFFSEILQST